MLTKYQAKALLLVFVLFIVFLGTFGSLITIPLGFLIIFTFSTVLMNFLGSQWTPTPDAVINRVVREAMKHGKGSFYDLGSGDARIVIAVSKRAKMKAVGLEIDPIKCLISTVMIKASRSNGSVTRKNFFKANLSDADMIYCYLPTRTMEKLELKMKKLRKGTIIMAYCIKFPNMKPIKELKPEKIYIYKIK